MITISVKDISNVYEAYLNWTDLWCLQMSFQASGIMSRRSAKMLEGNILSCIYCIPHKFYEWQFGHLSSRRLVFFYSLQYSVHVILCKSMGDRTQKYYHLRKCLYATQYLIVNLDVRHVINPLGYIGEHFFIPFVDPVCSVIAPQSPGSLRSVY